MNHLMPDVSDAAAVDGGVSVSSHYVISENSLYQ